MMMIMLKASAKIITTAFFSGASLCLGIAEVHAVECEKNYAALKDAEMIEITAGDEIIRRFIQDGLTEADLTQAEIDLLQRIEEIQERRTRPVDDADLTILMRADEILASEHIWDRADDRQCEPADTTFSLYCALKFASIEVIGSYEHRRTALQEVRFAIEEKSNGRVFEHRMRDFNNAEETTFALIKDVLALSIRRVSERLNQQELCLL